MSIENLSEFLTYEDLSKILNLKISTLRKWMCEGKFKAGRDFIKLGKAKKSRVLFKRDLLKRIDKLF